MSERKKRFTEDASAKQHGGLETWFLTKPGSMSLRSWRNIRHCSCLIYQTEPDKSGEYNNETELRHCSCLIYQTEPDKSGEYNDGTEPDKSGDLLKTRPPDSMAGWSCENMGQ